MTITAQSKATDPCRTFPWLLREMRKRAGIKQVALAHRLGVHWTTVSRWECGKALPEVLLRPKLCGALACSEADLGLRPSRPTPGEVTLLGVAPEELTRRQLLARGTTAAMGVLAAPAMTVIGSRQQVNPAVVQHLLSFRRMLVEEDNLLGSGHLVGTVTDRVALIDGMCRSAPSLLRNELLHVAALYQELAGWLYQNTGHAREALWWSDRAIESAQEADDQLIVSYVLMRKAQLAMDAGDATRTVRLAQAAQRSERLTARVRAAAVQQEAHGHALAGDATESERRFDEALHIIDGGGAHDHVISELGSFCTARHIEAQRAVALVQLGQPGLALSIFETKLNQWPPSFERDRGLFLAQFALGHAANDDPEQAATVGREAAHIAGRSQCARTLARLDELNRRLMSHADLPAVRDFRELLATA